MEPTTNKCYNPKRKRIRNGSSRKRSYAGRLPRFSQRSMEHQQVYVSVCCVCVCVCVGYVCWSRLYISLCIIEPRDIYRRVSRGWQLWLPADPQLGAYPLTKGMWHSRGHTLQPTQRISSLFFLFSSAFSSSPFLFLFIYRHTITQVTIVWWDAHAAKSALTPYTCGFPIVLIRFVFFFFGINLAPYLFYFIFRSMFYFSNLAIFNSWLATSVQSHQICFSFQ